ncbi:hypothetical protein KY311_04380 [Candidatus Woesearchaeota archaeon]|nr:hypothetical protein [Candidatus Woesearchaeota archaeon]
MMRDKVLEIIRKKGPVVPVTVAKELKIDSLLSSAYLSELTSNKKAKISYTKVGGSPLYFVEGQEAKLQDYKEHLEPEEKKIFDILKKEKVLKDEELSPLMKAAVREIKDFAVPLKVNKTEIFWKWYLLSNEEATQIIKEKLAPKPKPQPKKEPEKKPEPKQQEPKKKEPAPEKEHDHDKKPEIKVEKKEELKPKPEQAVKKQHDELAKKKEELEEKEKELRRKESEIGAKSKELMELEELKRKREEEFAKKELELKKQIQDEKRKFEEELFRKEEELRKQIEEEKQKKLEEEKKEELNDDFFLHVKAYFDEKNIEIDHYEIIKKGKEIDFTIIVPSAVGEMKYYCKAKNKKKSNDGDLSTAYLKGQSMNLPTLFLSPGEVSKRALDMIGKEFKQLVVKKL